MKYILAIVLPSLSLMHQGKYNQGLVSMFLQLTVIGWLPASIWAIFSMSQKEIKRYYRANTAVNSEKLTLQTQ
jgi:uncharacterized membrane protein YqaE (UPF0057 family)